MTYASSWQDYSFIAAPKLSFPTFRKALVAAHDHFVPHERNNYHPHILSHRLLGLISLMMVAMKIAVIAAAAVGPASTIYSSAITTENILSLTNESRSAYQLAPLGYNMQLEQAAQKKAADMAAKGYFSHTSPEGNSPWWFIQQTGYTYITAGENLAVDFTQAESVGSAWMNSPGHRANILNKNYQQIGIGIATGQFEGHPTTFVVQMFGTPTNQNIALSNTPTPVATSEVPAALPEPTTVQSATEVKLEARMASVPAQVEQAASSPIDIVSTSTVIKDNQLVVTVTTSGEATNVTARYSNVATMLYPKSDTLWEGTIPLASLTGETNMTVTAVDMTGNSKQVAVASFTPSLQSNYKFLGSVKGAAISILGNTVDPKAFEQKFYLIITACLLVCLIIAIAVKRHVQHISLIANTSFVAILATMLWMAG